MVDPKKTKNPKIEKRELTTSLHRAEAGNGENRFNLCYNSEPLGEKAVLLLKRKKQE